MNNKILAVLTNILKNAEAGQIYENNLQGICSMVKYDDTFIK